MAEMKFCYRGSLDIGVDDLSAEGLDGAVLDVGRQDLSGDDVSGKDFGQLGWVLQQSRLVSILLIYFLFH
jgi:hypothetical protein